jgi:hypothetical protein
MEKQIKDGTAHIPAYSDILKEARRHYPDYCDACALFYFMQILSAMIEHAGPERKTYAEKILTRVKELLLIFTERRN